MNATLIEHLLLDRALKAAIALAALAALAAGMTALWHRTNRRR
ncbi:hypothetical protein ACFXPI_09330 [Streptomyces sp. NPDC059104]